MFSISGAFAANPCGSITADLGNEGKLCNLEKANLNSPETLNGGKKALEASQLAFSQCIDAAYAICVNSIK